MQAWSDVMVFERLLTRVSGDLFAVFEDVLSEMGSPALGRVLELWSVRI